MKTSDLTNQIQKVKLQFKPKLAAIVPESVYKLPTHFSVSSLSTFLSCRRKCWYSRVKQLVTKLSPDYFYVGRVWHEALEVLYSWQDYGAAVKQIKKTIKKESQTPWFTAEQYERMETDRTIITAMLHGYFEVYGKKDFTQWQFLRSEKEFVLKDFMNTGFDFVGRMDGVLKIKKGRKAGIWCLENKSTSNLTNYRLEQVKIDPQILGYMSAIRHLLGKCPKGVILNVIRKPSIRQKKTQTLKDYRKELMQDYLDRPSFYYNREYLYVGLKAVEAWEEETTNILLDYELACQQLDDKHFWYKNPSMCTQYGRCPYLSLCSRGESTRTLSMFRLQSDDEKKTPKKVKSRVVKKKREKIIDKRRRKQTRRSND